MTAEPAYEVRHSESSLRSLEQLSPSAQSKITDLLLEFGPNLRKFPDRVWRDPTTGTNVYRHPDAPLEITYRLDEARGVVTCLHLAAPLVPRVTAFISYSHKDRHFLEEFRKYLFTLEQQGKVEFWHDGEIEVGTPWERSLQNALRSAKAAILMVTQDFLNSEYINTKELPALKESADAGTVRVYWIPVRHCLYEDYWFARLQALGDPAVPLADLKKSQREKRLTEICRQLKRQLGE